MVAEDFSEARSHQDWASVGWAGDWSWWHLDENLDYGFKPRGT